MLKNRIFLTIIVLVLFLCVSNVNASSLVVPKINSFGPIADEANALRIDFNSNGNSGSNFSYEILNDTIRKAYNISGSSKFYVFQNLQSGKIYNVAIRVCSNGVYVCSKWTPTFKASLNSVINTPIITSISSPNNSSIKLTYSVPNNARGVEILNVTTNKSFRITDLNSYTIKNLNPNTTYKFKIRSYTNSAAGLTFSNYSSVKSLKTKGASLKTPTLSKANALSKNSIKLTYKVKGSITGVEIYNVTTGKRYRTKNKINYTVKKLSKNKTYKFKIRTYLSKNSSVNYSSYSKVKSASTKISSPELIATTAEDLAWPDGTSEKIWRHSYGKYRKFTSWSQLGKARPTDNFKKAYDKVRKNHWKIGSSRWGYWTRIGASCDVFVGTAVRASGYDKSFPFTLGESKSSQLGHMKSSSKWKRVSKAKRGDVCYRSGHVRIYLGHGKVAEAGYKTKRFGAIQHHGCGGYKIYRAVK